MLGAIHFVANDFMYNTVREQVRFPRSKKKRIRRKWAKQRKNWATRKVPWENTHQMGDTIFAHPELIERLKRALEERAAVKIVQEVYGRAPLEQALLTTQFLDRAYDHLMRSTGLPPSLLKGSSDARHDQDQTQPDR